VKKPELLLLVAIWEFIAAFFCLIGIAAIALIGFPAVIYEYRYGLGLERPGYMGALFGLSVALIILLIYFAIATVGGIGLLLGREWGRIVSIVHAALSLFSIPFGTVIGILILIYLTRSSVRDYFAKPGTHVPTVVPPQSPPAPPVSPPAPSPPPGA